MTISLREVQFENDFLSLHTADGGELIINSIDENIDGTAINGFNIIYKNEQKSVEVKCPSVIGLGNDFMKLYSFENDATGRFMTKELLPFCYIDVFEEDEDSEDSE